MGSDFPQLHELFGNQYETMFGEIDRLTEHMRYLRMKAIGPISRVVETSEFPEATNSPTAESMVSQLLADNKSFCDMCAKISEVSEKQRSYATANLVQDLMESHGKFVWMLRSFLKE